MKITIAWWNLNRSEQTIETLRQYLHDQGVDPWQTIEGMRFKCWISDANQNLWGAVMLWESSSAMHKDLPPNRATALIGYEPTVRYCFDVEATIEGKFQYQSLFKLGLSFETN